MSPEPGMRPWLCQGAQQWDTTSDTAGRAQSSCCAGGSCWVREALCCHLQCSTEQHGTELPLCRARRAFFPWLVLAMTAVTWGTATWDGCKEGTSEVCQQENNKSHLLITNLTYSVSKKYRVTLSAHALSQLYFPTPQRWATAWHISIHPPCPQPAKHQQLEWNNSK